ncbi:MAG: carbonic anhydrase [Candidatus Nitrosocosmicus sp.]|nr:carbonic anhydrase [Candidatus Nitrosocosmicus sp.]
MIDIESIISQNRQYAENFTHGDLPPHPSKKVAVLTCMDARIFINEVLGLKIGEAHIIRNAGGIVTDDALRSLIISHELLGTEKIIIINHTECGMATFNDEDLQKRISEKYNSDASDIKFHSFSDLEENVRDQIKKIRTSPFLSNITSVLGFI